MGEWGRSGPVNWSAACKRALSKLGRRRYKSYPAVSYGDEQGGERLPGYFVVGPPRTGTTWLHEILREKTHLPSPTKETRFFDIHFHRGVAWYQAHFRNCGPDRPIGEVAPTYFASESARERIARLIPSAKIICVFRNPVERVFSLYRLKSAYGLITGNFEQALTRDPELLETGRYATNLKAWQQAFGKQQVLATLYDDLRDTPQAYIDEVSTFIGIPQFCLSQSQTGRINASESMTHPRSYQRTRSASLAADWFKARRLDNLVARVKQTGLHNYLLSGGPPFAELSSEISRKIFELFRSEVVELESILNRDLSAWDPRRRSLNVRAAG